MGSGFPNWAPSEVLINEANKKMSNIQYNRSFGNPKLV